MVVTLRKSIHWVILLALILTPLFAVGEVLALLRGLVQSQSVAYTPVYIKAIKDLLLVLIASLALLAIGASGRTNRLIVPFLLLFFYVIIVALPALAVDPRLPVAGLRWIFPMFLVFLLIHFVDETLLRRIAFVLALLLLLHFAVQLFQLFFMSTWYGVNMFGLAGRVPGLFFIPVTASFFATLCLYFAVFHLQRGRLRTSVLATTPVSVFLTQSGTGLIVLAALGLLLVLGARKAWLLLPAGPVVTLLLLAALPMLTSRESNYVQVSGGTRIEIFVDLISQGELFPSLFGHATNTAGLMSSSLDFRGGAAPIGMIADSAYTSVLGNLGLIGLGMLLLVGLAWMLLLLQQKEPELYAFTLIFFLYGFTVTITEAFPMNLLFAVLAAYYCRSFRFLRMSTSRAAVGGSDPTGVLSRAQAG